MKIRNSKIDLIIQHRWKGSQLYLDQRWPRDHWFIQLGMRRFEYSGVDSSGVWKKTKSWIPYLTVNPLFSITFSITTNHNSDVDYVSKR
jgi:hypothetical protein